MQCSFPRATTCLRLAAGAALMLGLFSTARLWAQTTSSTYDFENSTDGWTAFNGASTPVSTNAAAYTGSYSLLTTTSSSGSGGPSIPLTTTLQAGATYSITGYVLLTPGESAANADFTMKRTDPTCTSGGGTCYDTIGSYEVPVDSSSWAEIGGSYTVPTTETGLMLYAQLVGATSAQSFYLDDVVITETAPPPGGTPVATYTFADGADGWAPYGSPSPSLSSAISPMTDPSGSAHSLLVTDRKSVSAGAGLNLLSVNNIVAGATYQVTAYVMLAQPDSSSPTVTLSTNTANCANAAGVGAGFATSAPLSSTAWTEVQGTFSFSDLPGPPISLTLIANSSSPTDSFYLSDVVISEVATPPLPVSDQDNSGITSTFEDGTDGWSGRGSAAVSVVSSPGTPPSGDTSALLVTGRTANWNGPQISVSGKMYVGSVYNLSVWVMMQPVGDGASHIVNMSLQTTYNGTTSYPGVTGYPGVTIPDDGQWHQITVTNYTMSSNYDSGSASLYLQTMPASGTDDVSFYMTDFQLTYVPPPAIQTEIPSIYKTYADYFPIGAAVDPTDLSGAHAQLLTKHFDSMTPGNSLKWSSTEPNYGSFNYTTGDSLVGEAVCHGMKVRGQNLVWATGEETPSYAYGDGTSSAANQAAVTHYIQEHIQNEVQHYGREVYAWDVVNEPIDPTQSDCLAHGPFYKVLGPSYINVAFEAARRYAPAGTKLFLNDYSLNDPARLACLVKVVHNLLSEGVPIDGIGHEMHNNINYPSLQAMATSIETIHRDFPRLDQQVTELDESVYNAGDTTSNYGNNIPASVLAEQGWLYKDYFDLFRYLHRDLTGVTLWGMADDDTWLDTTPVTRTDYPLPFNMQLQAKPAYWGIVDPTQLPGYGLRFSLSAANTGKNTQTWTITATNGPVGPAYATTIASLSLNQIAGRRCTPTIAAPSSYPIVLGDIAAGGSATAAFTVDFSACQPDARFVLNMPWTSSVYHTGTFLYPVNFDWDQDRGGSYGWNGHDRR